MAVGTYWSHTFPPVLTFPEGSFIKDDLHLLQPGDGDHLTVHHSPCGGKGYILLPKLFAAHWVIKAEWTYQTIDMSLKDKECTHVPRTTYTRLLIDTGLVDVPKQARGVEDGGGDCYFILAVKSNLTWFWFLIFFVVQSLFPHIVVLPTQFPAFLKSDLHSQKKIIFPKTWFIKLHNFACLKTL